MVDPGIYYSGIRSKTQRCGSPGSGQGGDRHLPQPGRSVHGGGHHHPRPRHRRRQSGGTTWASCSRGGDHAADRVQRLHAGELRRLRDQRRRRGNRATGHPNGVRRRTGQRCGHDPAARRQPDDQELRASATTPWSPATAATALPADATHNAGRGGWGGWARGGAIYCAPDTSPKFINCIIENNFAQGGNGGNGGAGVANGGLANYGGNYTPPVRVNIDPDKLGTEPADDDLWKIWEWDYAMLRSMPPALRVSPRPANVPRGGGPYVGDYRWYSGYGGGVFLDRGSKAEFVECIIRGNRTLGGLSGQGGAGSRPADNCRAADRVRDPQLRRWRLLRRRYDGARSRSCMFQNNSASVTGGRAELPPGSVHRLRRRRRGRTARPACCSSTATSWTTWPTPAAVSTWPTPTRR